MRGIKREISEPDRNLGPKSYDALKDIKKQVSGPIRRLTYKKLMKAEAERAAERARPRQDY